MHRTISIPLTLAGAIGVLLSGCHSVGDLVKSQPAQLVTVPSIARPEYLQPVTDPVFGTTITRIADRARFGSKLPELRHLYAKNQPWNADESYLLLNYKYPGALLDGRTYKFIRWVRQPSESVWSNVNPSLMYGTIATTNQFVKLNVNRGNNYTVLHKFREYDRIYFGEWEGNLSNNDRYAALVGVKAGKLDFLVYDILKNRVASRQTQPSGTTISSGNESTINNITMSQSGKYVIVQYNQSGTGVQRGIHLLDRVSGKDATRTLKFVRQLSSRGGSHFDTCIDSTGSEAIVVTDDHSPAIVSVRYSTGKKTVLLPASKSNYNIHVSCRNLKRPGWAYISEFAGDIDPARPDLVKTTPDRIFALKLDGSSTIEQFAQPHHSPSKAYERQPHSVPNRDGSKVIFASDWGDPSEPVYSYITRKQR